jgi:hypothetical protein
MKNKINKMTIKSIVIAVLMAFTFSAAFAQAPTLSIKASKTTGSPGDKITFSWNINDPASKIYQTTINMDGESLNVTNSFVWTAIPGTHVFYIQLRYDKKKPFVVQEVILEISGGEGHFNHPGLYNSAEELDKIRENVTGEANHPMKLGWKQMLNSVSSGQTGKVKFASLDWQPHGLKTVTPTTQIEKLALFDDARAAYAHALQWVVTGEQKYADKAIAIYNSWSQCTDIIDNFENVYNNLYTSWIGHYTMAGAEIIRYYKNNGKSAGWKDSEIEQFENFCRVLERVSLEWKGYGNGVKGGHNQDVAVARTRMALGIFMDDKALFDEGTRLLFERKYTGEKIEAFHGHAPILVGTAISKAGEVMELNRDPGHGTGTFNALTNAAEILRHQKNHTKYNLYDLLLDGEKTPRLLKGAEFAANTFIETAKGNTTKLSFNPEFKNKRVGQYSELILNYYKNLLHNKFNTKNTEKANEMFRKDPNVGYCIPWTTLTHAKLSK